MPNLPLSLVAKGFHDALTLCPGRFEAVRRHGVANRDPLFAQRHQGREEQFFCREADGLQRGHPVKGLYKTQVHGGFPKSSRRLTQALKRHARNRALWGIYG